MSESRWAATRQLLGVAAFIGAFIVEATTTADIPIAIYSIIGWLLGMDLLREALSTIGQRRGGE